MNQRVLIVGSGSHISASVLASLSGFECVSVGVLSGADATGDVFRHQIVFDEAKACRPINIEPMPSNREERRQRQPFYRGLKKYSKP